MTQQAGTSLRDGTGTGTLAGRAPLRDTTYTKVFVGGLAWETKRETMRLYFDQFGEILEAVIIIDKNTGRSKGYGFVTFRDPEAARRACVDGAPIIDGRRANCNLASLGLTRPRLPFISGNRFRPIHVPLATNVRGGRIADYAGLPTFAQHGSLLYQQGFPYQASFQFGCPSYSLEYGYQQYNAYAGFSQLHPGHAYGRMFNPGVYPYFGISQTLQSGGPYSPSQSYVARATHFIQHGSPKVGVISTLPQQYTPSTGD
ncbi:hypothetical protein O6H91_08G094200 [Diphasiastrum complanatum]|uniref:Uncharacterized protein n=1 Tax=Diphasiastrum complanatum TaxID=34168 RepID=A0ACC2D040_DIPCM|nr:hypothetical protein O6H91_08G094200 [Diphasiastrum complanatum]